jgi:hypothetical protein
MNKDMKIKSRLQLEWGKRHAMIRHASCPVAEVGENSKTLCHKLCRCVCISDPEKPYDIPMESVYFHQKLISVMKLVFWSKKKQRSEPRKLLDDGFIIVSLTAESNEAEAPLDQDLFELVFHFGYANYRSWDFSALELKRDPGADRDHKHCQFRVMTAAEAGPTYGFYDSIALFGEKINFSVGWKARFYVIDSSEAVSLNFEDMIANRVDASHFDGIDDLRFWKGSALESHDRNERKRKQMSRRNRIPMVPRPRVPRGAQQNNDEDDEQDDGDQQNTAADDGDADDSADDASMNGSNHSSLVPSSDEAGPSGNSDVISDLGESLPGSPVNDDEEDYGYVSVDVWDPSDDADNEDPSNSDPSSSSSSDSSSSSRDSRQENVQEPIFIVPGYGSLRYNRPGKFIRAHCNHHEGLCRISRTTNSSTTNISQGRPIGELMSWLIYGQTANDICTDRDSHVHCNKVLFTTSASRVAGREYFLTLPGAHDFAVQFERPKLPTEGEEPLAA